MSSTSSTSLLNEKYGDYVQAVVLAQKASEIRHVLRQLQQLRVTIEEQHPEYIDSLNDIDYYIATAAYRINDADLFESTVQRHYYDDARFKKLYQSYVDAETTNAWNNIVKANSNNLERTFIRSLSVVILAGIGISIILRK